MHLSDEMTAESVPGWDSLANIDLIVGIEREFKIRFTTGDVTNLKNVGDLIAVIRRKI
ncbi:MAG: acyl carrier protein [Bryobacteraceae bacterium]